MTTMTLLHVVWTPLGSTRISMSVHVTCWQSVVLSTTILSVGKGAAYAHSFI